MHLFFNTSIFHFIGTLNCLSFIKTWLVHVSVKEIKSCKFNREISFDCNMGKKFAIQCVGTYIIMTLYGIAESFGV